ncbi:MAG: hypothetical protein CMO55_19785 [Verrucomicrobiales bacterium]|nr:hypothetical protein [Verrucomicrobiales bacterium]
MIRFFLFLSFLLTSSALAEKNVLLIISDNQSWFDMGCYGHPVVKTPNLDQLAAEGVQFEQAFATTASCGPSRAVMYTGLLTHSNGQYAHPHREHNQQLREDVVTIFSMLKGNGYRTALLGKDHIKPMEKYPIDFKKKVNSRDVTAMAEAAREFLNQGEDPFFLVLSYNDPHPVSIDGPGWGIPEETNGYTPIEYDPTEVPVPPFLPDTEHVREGIAGYYQQISRMDHGVGLALTELEKSGHKDDTLVIFISDHGTSEPGAMGTHYEPGVRVPFIVRQPGLKNPASPNKALVAFTDLTPTILDWTGTKFDEYPLHGRSILPILDQTDPKGWGEALLSHVGHDIFAYYPMRTLRGRKYKLIWNVTPGAEYPLPIDAVQRRTWVELRERGDKMIGQRPVENFLHRPRLELYDLEADPWEVNNLSDSPDHSEIKEEMVERLMAHLEEQKDPWIRKFHPLGKEQ